MINNEFIESEHPRDEKGRFTDKKNMLNIDLEKNIKIKDSIENFKSISKEIETIKNSKNKIIYENEVKKIPANFGYGKFAELPIDIQYICKKHNILPSKTGKKIFIGDVKKVLEKEYYPEKENIYELEKEKEKTIKKFLKEISETNDVQNFHKNNDLDFEAKPENEILAEKKFYKSPVHNHRQSSEYSIAIDNLGNIYYVRKSNHWGFFTTNVYDSDYINEHKKEFEEFKAKNPELDKNDFLESKGFDTSDIYDRISFNIHNWNLKGGKDNNSSSQKGYIKIGNINDIKRKVNNSLYTHIYIEY